MEGQTCQTIKRKTKFVLSDKEKNSSVQNVFNFKMIFTGFLLAFIAAIAQAQNPEEEIPFVVASHDGGKVLQEPIPPPLTILGSPDARGRGDIEVEEDQPAETQFQGYFYPKPLKPFNLPAFRTVDASSSLVEEGEGERTEHSRRRRSPYRRPHYPSPPPFRPGFIPPHHIRPVPYPHGRPHRY